MPLIKRGEDDEEGASDRLHDEDSPQTPLTSEVLKLNPWSLLLPLRAKMA